MPIRSGAPEDLRARRREGRRSPRVDIVDEITQFILDEGLRPGDPLPSEMALCEELDVSRPHLREALRTLQSLDIISIRHGRGTSVGELSLSPMVKALLFRVRLGAEDSLRPVREVIDMRERLDLSVAEEITAACAGRRHEELHGIVEAMQARFDAGENFTEEDRDFHRVLLDELDNELLAQMNSAFWQIHVEAIPLLGIAPAQEIADTVAAHRAILEAVESGDAEAYREAVHAHYAPLRRQLGMNAEG